MAARRARKPTMPVLRCTGGGGGGELFEFWEWEVLLTMRRCCLLLLVYTNSRNSTEVG